MEIEQLALKWNNHSSAFFQVLKNIRRKESYADVTLACDGKFFPVHKLVLSTCSDYFEEIFEQTQCKHPVIVLKDVSHKDLESLLNYMYIGEVNVIQNELSSLIKAAELLRVKGLAISDEPPSQKPQKRVNVTEKSEEIHAIPNKRNKKSNILPDVTNIDAVIDSEQELREGPQQNIEGFSHVNIKEEIIETKYKPLEIKNENLEAEEKEESGNCSNSQADYLTASSISDQDSNSHFILPVPVLEEPEHLSGDLENDADMPFDVDPSDFVDSSNVNSQMVCDEVGTSSATANWEKLMFTNGLFWQCQYPNCDFKTDREDKLRRHAMKHTGENEGSFAEQFVVKEDTGWRCSYENCAYSTTRQSSIKRHELTHTGEKPFECNLCSYSSCQKSHLTMHMRSHDGLRCSYENCSYHTTRKSSIKRHEMTHTGEKPFQCNICSYSSSQKSHLTIHMRTHTGEKPFACEYCSYACTSKNDLRKHVKGKAHVKTYKCTVCSFSTNDGSIYLKHFRTHGSD